MSLMHVGTTACPFCNQLAPVGISLEGTGNSVHLICKMCMAQVQAHRYGRIGMTLLERAANETPTSEKAAEPKSDTDWWDNLR